jgi:hypothetical protein
MADIFISYSRDDRPRVAPLSQPAAFLLHLKETRPMRADPRFLPLMKKSGVWEHWVTSKTMPDWCKLPEEQGFETCAELRKAQAQ